MRRLFVMLPLLAALSACIGAPEERRRGATANSAQGITPRPEARACLAELGRTEASYTPLPDQYYGAGCSALNAVRLSALRSDDASLALTNLGPVTCPLANTFAAWARFGVDRAARQILGSELVRIETMGSYNCRNVAGSNRLSAHATANAIDVSAFVLADGRRITVSEDWREGSAAERRFLQVIHSSACRRFGTVLGPDYNRAHHDHIHLEFGDRAYCR